MWDSSGWGELGESAQDEAAAAVAGLDLETGAGHPVEVVGRLAGDFPGRGGGLLGDHDRQQGLAVRGQRQPPGRRFRHH